MASIVKDLKAGRLIVYWVGPDRKRHGKSFALNQKRAAKKFAGEQDAQSKDRRSGIDLETAAVLYLEDRQKVTELGTWTRYESVLNQFVKHMGAARLAAVNAQNIGKWRAARLDTHARTTVRNDLKGLRAFFSWCVARGWIKDNPAKSVDIPRCKRTLPRFLTPDVAEQLLNASKAADPAFRLICLLALRAGMRRNEILTLPWDCVNFEQGIISVRGKSIEERIIPMHSEVRDALLSWPRNSDYVFPPAYKVANCVRSPEIAKRFNAWLKEGGWNITLHGLRHSFAVRAVTRGASERAVGDLLGHQDLRTVRIYARSYLDHLRSIVEDGEADHDQTATPSAQTSPKETPT